MTTRELLLRAGLPDRLTYSVAEVSAATGYSCYRLREAIHAGSLPTRTPRGDGRRNAYRLIPEEVDEWIGGL